MTVNRTTLLDLPLPVTGTESGTWGDTTNNGLTQYMDIAIAGMSNLTSSNFTAGALTIETTEGTSAGTNITATSAQYAGFRVTSLAANSTITVGNTGTSPARSYRLINADSTYNLTFKATGQTGVTLLPGQSAVVAFNGTDYVIVGTVGAGTATDNAITRFDGTTGEILQNSAATIDDTGAATFVGSVNVSGTSASGADLKLYEDTDNGTNYVAFKSPGTVASNVTWTLPSADGSPNQAIVTNGSGTLSFASVTTSPGGSTTQVQYNNAGAFAGSSNLTFDGTNLTVGGTATATKLIPTGNVTAGNGMYLPTTNTLAFSTNGSEQMRIDSSGNVGIGVTPPTVSQGRLLSLAYSGSGISVTSGTSLDLTNNAYYNSGWKYGQSGKTARIQLSDDQIYFGNATTGTAGNAITFTQTLAIQQGKTLALEGASLQTGTGITFPATQSASSDANTLDDYEEGSWTGTLTGGTSNPTTPVTATGYYTKIGRQVTASIYFSNVNTTGASGSVTITGLPFSSNASIRNAGSGFSNLFTFFTNTTAWSASADGTTIYFDCYGSDVTGSDLQHNAGTGRYLRAQVSYQV